jgi:hypothetical protein
MLMPDIRERQVQHPAALPNTSRHREVRPGIRSEGVQRTQTRADVQNVRAETPVSTLAQTIAARAAHAHYAERPQDAEAALRTHADPPKRVDLLARPAHDN